MPTDIKIPTQGLFRALGDNGDSVYSFDQGGTPTRYSITNPTAGVNNNYGANLDYLKQYGVNWDALPTFNRADIDQHLMRMGNVGSNGVATYNNGGGLEDLARLAGLAPQTKTETLNAGATASNPNTNYFQPGQGGNPTSPLNNPNANYFQSGQGGNPTQQQLQALQNKITSGATSGTTGSTTGSSSGNAPTGNTDQYLQSYLDSLKPSADEQGYQKQLDSLIAQESNVNASRDLGIQGVNEQPIATPFLAGQATAITNRAATQMGALTAQAVPLQTQLARAQAMRQSAMDVSKAVLDYQQKKNEPYTLAAGQTRYDGSGKVIAQGQNKETINSGSLTYTPQDYAQDSQALERSRGKDNWVDPNVYLTLYKAWSAKGGTTADFIKTYPPKYYANPANTWLPDFLKNKESTRITSVNGRRVLINAEGSIVEDLGPSTSPSGGSLY